MYDVKQNIEYSAMKIRVRVGKPSREARAAGFNRPEPVDEPCPFC